MKLLASLLTGTALTLVAMAPALANQELAQKKACMACHGVDKKIVGPAFLD
ncbi:MAG: cytochrome C', partial [Rubrivivax sp.]